MSGQRVGYTGDGFAHLAFSSHSKINSRHAEYFVLIYPYLYAVVYRKGQMVVFSTIEN